MVNELNNTISEAIGKLEKTVAIIEYLKFSIQDGMVNISDEDQKKQVLGALDKYTDIQKLNFKYIQAIEKLGSDMKLNLNFLYPILPADVLRTVLGEQNNYEDLPEDFVSKIMGDESNNLNDSPVDDSIQEVSDDENENENENENNLMSQIMELAPKTESEVVTTPTEATPEATSESATPPVEATPEATSESATPSVEATPEATSETPNELDSIVLPSLDETSGEVSAEKPAVESTSSPNTEDTVLLPLNDENNGTVAEASTENKSTESTSPAKPEDTVLLPLSDENDDTISAEKSTENTADSFELLPLEVENPVNDKVDSEKTNAVLPLDATSLSEEKKDDSMVGENKLVLPVLHQSLDIDEKPKADIASLDTSPVHAHLTLIPRGDSKALAVTSKQFSKLAGSLVGQMGNPEIAHVLNFPSQDSHEASLGGMIQESEEATASLENEEETDLETMMQKMEKAYSEGQVDVAERLSEKISNISKARQKTLSLSSAA